MRLHSSSIARAAAASLLLVALATAAGAQTPTRRSGFVGAADGAMIHYVEAGTGPAMLFVPGWTMPATIFDAQIDHFARTRHVVAMDPRAQGESTKTGDGLYPAARARDIRSVIDSLKLAPVVIVAWSMGVAEVAAYVEQFGTTGFSHIVLVDGVAGLPFDPKVTPGLLAWVGSLQKDRTAETASFVKNMFASPRTDAYLRSITDAALKTPTSAAVALMVGALTNDHRSALNGVDKPTLIVVTPNSTFGAAYEDLHARIKGSLFEKVTGAGHALFVDQPQAFNSMVERFIGAR